MSVTTKPQARLRRRRRVRAKVRGTAERPRLSVFRSNRGIRAQLIDDLSGHTLAAVNWTEGDLRSLGRMEQAKRAGELIAERAKAAGVETVIYAQRAPAGLTSSCRWMVPAGSSGGTATPASRRTGRVWPEAP